MTESVIVEAVGAISFSASAIASGQSGGSAISVLVQEAMSSAVIVCSGAGVTDPTVVRATMLAARERVKNVEGAVNGAMIAEYRQADVDGCDPEERQFRVMAAGVAARAEAEARFPPITEPVTPSEA